MEEAVSLPCCQEDIFFSPQAILQSVQGMKLANSLILYCMSVMERL